MSKLIWNKIGGHFYETGVSAGVLFPRKADGSYPLGVVWDGLISVTESPSGAEPTALYASNIKYLSMLSAEEFNATVEAYTYPPEFEACNGEAELASGVTIGQQSRQHFGLVYKTIIGNDTESNDHGYKIHIIYGAQAAPSEKAYGTVNETPEAITFSWELSTTPIEIPGFKPSAKITINSTTVDADKLKKIEDNLFGRDAVTGETPVEAIVPHLLTPEELMGILAEA